MLLKHFETSGQFDLGSLTHWEKANSEALKELEAWVWGMRYWGRETLFRIGLYGFMLCKSLWDKGDAGESSQVKTVKMGSGGTLQEMLDTCMRWAKLPGEAVAFSILQLRGEGPEAFLSREVPTEDQEGVFAFTLLACDRMAGTVVEPRDKAACMAGQAMVCGARALMASGMAEKEAVEAARAFLIREMRTWFGPKW